MTIKGGHIVQTKREQVLGHTSRSGEGNPLCFSFNDFHLKNERLASLEEAAQGSVAADLQVISERMAVLKLRAAEAELLFRSAERSFRNIQKELKVINIDHLSNNIFMKKVPKRECV